MGNRKSKPLLQQEPSQQSETQEPPPKRILHAWTIDDERARNTLFVRTMELKKYKKILKDYFCSAHYSNYRYKDFSIYL